MLELHFICHHNACKNNHTLVKQIFGISYLVRSLGIIFYELLYGDTPWQAQTEEELLSNIYRIKIKFPSHINSNKN